MREGWRRPRPARPSTSPSSAGRHVEAGQPLPGGRRHPVPLPAMIVDPYFYLAATVAVLIVGMAKGGFGGGIAVVGVPADGDGRQSLPGSGRDVADPDGDGTCWPCAPTGVGGTGGNLRILLPAAMLGTLLGFVTARAVSADGAARPGRRRRPRLRGGSTFGRRPSDRTRPPRAVPGLFWGATAGFTSFSIHAGGPPLQAFLLPQRMHRTTFQATSVLFFFVVNWSKVGPYYWLGQWTTDNLLTSPGPAAAGAGRGVPRPLPARPGWTTSSSSAWSMPRCS